MSAGRMESMRCVHRSAGTRMRISRQLRWESVPEQTLSYVDAELRSADGTKATVPCEVAALAGCGDVALRVQPAILSGNQMLCRGLELKCLFASQAMTCRKG